MRKTRWFIGLLILAALFTLTAIAQTNLPPATNPITPSGSPFNDLALLLLPVITPIIIAIGKFALPRTPSWVLPILAPALGALLNYITAKATGAAANPMLALALGSAGVGLREIIDQAKTRITEGPKESPGVPK